MTNTKSEIELTNDDSIITKPQSSNSVYSHVKDLKSSLGLDLFVLMIATVCFILSGAIGMIIHGVFTKERGPIYLRNHFIGLWFCSLIVFYGLQVFYSLFKNITGTKKAFHIIEIIYFAICNLALLITIICYIIAGKADAVVWSIIIAMEISFNIAILVLRRKRENSNILDKDNIIKADKRNNCLTSCCLKNFFWINIIFRVIFLIFLAFLANGSVFIGGMKVTYPARGKFVNVPLEDNSGRTLRMHYLCDGPINNSFPIYMFEGDGTHGMADYLGLQKYLKNKNRRSCIWDKPGLGYSEYLFADMHDFSLIYHNFFKLINEKSPFIFVGWGGGGSIVYKYALTHPEMVYSITFLDVSPNLVEFIIPKILKNLTDSEYKNYFDNEIAGRYSLFRIINGLGVPWGLMSLFVPLGKSDPPEYRNEINWFMLTDKTWTTQYYLLGDALNDVDNYTSLKPNITLNHIMTVLNDQQIVDKQCKPKKLDQSSADCQYEIQANKKLIELRLKLATYNTVINCTLSDCSLGYYIFDNPKYTVDNLMNLYLNASL